jgi:hypothetical protein
MTVVLGRFVCATCGWATAEFDGLLTAYRMATAPQEGVWSAIEAERQEQRASQAAREIADLLAQVVVRQPAHV